MQNETITFAPLAFIGILVFIAIIYALRIYLRNHALKQAAQASPHTVDQLSKYIFNPLLPPYIKLMVTGRFIDHFGEFIYPLIKKEDITKEDFVKCKNGISVFAVLWSKLRCTNDKDRPQLEAEYFVVMRRLFSRMLLSEKNNDKVRAKRMIEIIQHYQYCLRKEILQKQNCPTTLSFINELTEKIARFEGGYSKIVVPKKLFELVEN